MVQDRRRWALLAAAVFCCQAVAPATPRQRVIARIDLSKPFHLPPGASFTATQGAPVQDPNGGPGDVMPGSIYLCVRASASARCSPNLNSALGYDSDMSPTAHFLQTARIVDPHGGRAAPLLYLQVGSLYSGDGAQGHAAVMLAYRPS